MSHVHHHLKRDFQIILPVGEDRPGLWELHRHAHDRIKVMPTFHFAGVVKHLADTIAPIMFGTGAIHATFEEEESTGNRTRDTLRRVGRCGVHEIIELHESLLSVISKLDIEFANGRDVGPGFLPYIDYPYPNRDYAFEQRLGLGVLMSFDAKGGGSTIEKEYYLAS